MTMATFHPDRYRFAGSLSGFLTPSNTTLNGAITAGLAQFGGVDTRNMWGLPQLGRWKWHDPDVHVQLLADNNTRLWVYSPSTLTCSDPAAMIGYCDQAQGSNRYVLSALPLGRRPQRALRLPRWPQPRLGQLVRTAGGDVGRTRRHHQVGTFSVTGSALRQPVPWRDAARGTTTGRSSKVVGNLVLGRFLRGPADRMLRRRRHDGDRRAAGIRDRAGTRTIRCAAARTAATERGLGRADRDRAAARLPRRAQGRRGEAVERPAGTQHRVVCVSGSCRQAERSGRCGTSWCRWCAAMCATAT